ncbi:hypothetical protein N7510_011615 [Penicillium lagena]|uniref:uncharacterized protein n=1 Tax=Penicillium lagena TaxID=94218 RepID=UPI002541174A|nr:uncharacterized protein N7510_011615 [Penicillium lagena]KAJ5602081.1 hypothetical protein N7510_011615 [Penicillium lagena]
MGDRRSDSSYDGKIEDAKITMRMNAKTLNQLSSSAQAAQQSRGKSAILNLQNAVQNYKEKEQSSGNESQRDGQDQSGKK